MILLNLGLFLLFLVILVKCAEYAIRYSTKVSISLKIPEFVVSFVIVALISILPESTISIISAIKGEPELGLGTLLGSNVADLSLVLGIATLFSPNGINVKSKILKNNFFYILLLLVPILLGFDGRFTRLDGLILFLLGMFFFIKIITDNKDISKKIKKTNKNDVLKNLIKLIFVLGILLLSAYFTVKYALNFANEVKIPVILVGITIIAFGTCLPELIFSIKAVKKNKDSLALGDIIGTVITDITIVLGIVALISPFEFNTKNIYVTGTAMVLAGIILTTFMKTDKTINKKEGLIMILFYVLFVFVEFFINKILI